MFNFEFILLILFALILTALILSISWLYTIKKENKKLKISKAELVSEYEKVDFKYAKEALDFLDRIIKDKFNYHLYNNILPIYLDKKIPEKKFISTIKEKIYVSIVGGFSTGTKKSILKFFTEKGIEIYIHEKIMVHLNQTDFRATNNEGQLSDKLNIRDLEKFLP